MKRRLLTSIAVTAFLLVASKAALGCVCVSSPEKPAPEQARARLIEDFNKAFAVFSGEVVAVDTFKVRFKVGKLWKGEFGDEIIMSTGAKDNGDGTFTTTSCDYGFNLGEKHLVFAYGGTAEEMRAYACTRTRMLKYADEEMKNLDEVWPHMKRGKDADGSDK